MPLSDCSCQQACRTQIHMVVNPQKSGKVMIDVTLLAGLIEIAVSGSL